MPVSDPVTEEDWLSCIPLPEYLAKIPADHILTVAGGELWVDGNGNHMTSDQFKTLYGVDPAVVWKAKEAYLAAIGLCVHIIK